MNVKCKECRFMMVEANTSKTKMIMQCHKRSPVCHDRWPEVYPHDGCGDFEAKKIERCDKEFCRPLTPGEQAYLYSPLPEWIGIPIHKSPWDGKKIKAQIISHIIHSMDGIQLILLGGIEISVDQNFLDDNLSKPGNVFVLFSNGSRAITRKSFLANFRRIE